MPEVNSRSLVLIIQAVDREINRLHALSDDEITSAEEISLVDFESLADELEELYESEKAGRQTNLPDYQTLVTDRGDEL